METNIFKLNVITCVIFCCCFIKVLPETDFFQRRDRLFKDAAYTSELNVFIEPFGSWQALLFSLTDLSAVVGATVHTEWLKVFLQFEGSLYKHVFSLILNSREVSETSLIKSLIKSLEAEIWSDDIVEAFEKLSNEVNRMSNQLPRPDENQNKRQESKISGISQSSAMKKTKIVPKRMKSNPFAL